MVDFVTKTGQRVNYAYIELDPLIKHVRPHLNRHGLSFRHSMETVDEDRIRVTCYLDHLDGATKEASAELHISGTELQTPAQRYMGTVTTGRRITLLSVLGLAGDDDIDGVERITPGEPITKKQRADLEALREEVGLPEEREMKLLDLYGLPSWDQVDTYTYPLVIKRLESAR